MNFCLILQTYFFIQCQEPDMCTSGNGGIPQQHKMAAKVISTEHILGQGYFFSSVMDHNWVILTYLLSSTQMHARSGI